MAVFYRNGVLSQEELRYLKGKLHDKSFKDGVKHFYYVGTEIVRQKHYPKGKVEVDHFDKKGVLEQRNLRNGVVELYDTKFKKLRKKIYPDGSEDVYDVKTGVLRQKGFPEKNDIKVEVYHSNGKVSERHFRNKEKFPNEIVWYDEKGKVFQVKTWDGKVVVKF